MCALRGVQLEGAGHGVQHGLGRPDLAPLFQTGVVVGADPRKLSDLLAAQPGYSAGCRRRGQSCRLGAHPGPHDPQELPKLCALTHVPILSRATARLYAEGRSAGPRKSRDRLGIQTSLRRAYAGKVPFHQVDGVGIAMVPYLRLNNGVTIPQLGLGVFQVPREQTQHVVEDALEAGYRHIDTAAGYSNESGVGAAIAASGIPREELFITTKLRNGEHGTAAEAFEASRQALGVDVIDLYLIHCPVPSKGLFVDAWRALEKIYASGETRAIGVSNFLQDHVDTLLACLLYTSDAADD